MSFTYTYVDWLDPVSMESVLFSVYLNFFLSDIEKIQSGIGDKAALFLQYCSTFITGFVIAFSRNWKLALVVATMLPLLSFLGASIGKVVVVGIICSHSWYSVVLDDA